MKEQFIHINTYGDKKYYRDKAMTILHREDGPACEYSDETKCWYINGKCHREDGPAIEYLGGHNAWYIDGIELTEEEFNARKNSCNGKVVEIDGKKYKLTEIE
jgi:hypothetical protein